MLLDSIYASFIYNIYVLCEAKTKELYVHIISLQKCIFVYIEGTWVWSDGTPVPLPGSPWHAWFDGEPDNQGGAEHCNVITNYMFWAIRKRLIDRYVWRDYSCRFNPSNEIQGYICERKRLFENHKSNLSRYL